MNHPEPRARRSALRWLKTPLLAASIGLAILTGSMDPADAMDTDIFAAQNAAGAAPNVLIVLDNTSDWNSNSQHWLPSGTKQGQAEIDAISQVIQQLPGSINIGVLEFVPGSGTGSDDGGYVRFAISPMGTGQGSTATTNKSNLTTVLGTMYSNFSSSSEENGANVGFGDLMYDAYNYFAGGTPYAASGDVPSSKADSRGYTTAYSKFKSPLSADTSCASNYIIFIGNAGNPNSDKSSNTTALAAAGGNTTQLKLPVYTAQPTVQSTNLGYSSACYTSQPTGTPADYASQCPSASSTYDSCSYSTTDTKVALDACPSGTQRYSVVGSIPITTTSTTTTTSTATGTTSLCYASSTNWTSGDTGGLTCPSNTTSTSGNVTTTTNYSCSYAVGTTGTACGKGNSNKGYTFPLTQTITKTVQAVTNTGQTQDTSYGNTLSCYASQASCVPTDSSCKAGSNCSCTTAVSPPPGICPAGTRYQVLGNKNVTLETPTGTFQTDPTPSNADEWARFLHEIGVPVTDATGSVTHQTVSTYTIDVYKDQPNAGFSGLMAGMARAGGGKYFAATDENAIISSLTSIFSEIQAVNSTFASAALPISATNRAQNANQVYIGMFRPDQTDHPRWFGNLKRYQVDTFNGSSDLGGADGKSAVSATTGFVTPCALSWWTNDAGNYWYDTTLDQSRIFITQALVAGTSWGPATDDSNFAKGTCGTTGTWSDNPDGPTVEKGAAAEMLRTQTSRTMYTVPASTTSTTTLTPFNLTNVTGISANSIVNANVVKFIMGQDVTGEVASVPSASMRPSIHGEVIHSRPLPVDYGGSTGVVVYYGAGDGVFHAVSGNTGQELWSFVAPETYPQLQRLMDNSPLIQAPYPTPPGQTQLSGTTAKPFFFDGSTGQYQNADNSKVWIYPAMRRGGRMLYSFDVTTPTAPTLKWRVGCPDLGDDTGCTSGLTGIGQTWSTPQLANVNGYKVGGSNAPVVIVGGGYDGCEDADSATPSCSSPKGAKVYVLDADNGTVIATFSTDRSVIADVALVDSNFDGVVDAAYAADTGGNIYRVDFPTTATDTSTWAIHKVAYTNVTPSDSHRKFEFEPAVLPYQGKVYVAISSGDREHPLSASYPYTTPVVNRFYVYLDDPSRSTATDLDGNKMLDQTANPPTCASSGILPGGSSYGWHMDLNSYGQGEQGVTSPIILGGMVSFSTNRPVVSGAMCSTSLGEARGYWVNLLNGSGAIGVNGTCGGALSATFVGGGLPPSPVAATVNVDGKNQTIVIGSVSRSGGSSSAISAQQVRPPISNKRNRTYWRDNRDTR
jgi:Tfp pilus tip-associated adhesin PilY1